MVASPVYYASANNADRLPGPVILQQPFDKTIKVNQCGLRQKAVLSTFDELNKYFTISGMPVA
ncbi:MAG: hypothetical protein V8S98_05615 [Lachnospiraceae bacterium]